MSVVIGPIQMAHVKSFHACLDVVAREKRYLAMTSAPSLEQVENFMRGLVASNGVQFVAMESNVEWSLF